MIELSVSRFRSQVIRDSFLLFIKSLACVYRRRDSSLEYELHCLERRGHIRHHFNAPDVPFTSLIAGERAVDR